MQVPFEEILNWVLQKFSHEDLILPEIVATLLLNKAKQISAQRSSGGPGVLDSLTEIIERFWSERTQVTADPSVKWDTHFLNIFNEITELGISTYELFSSYLRCGSYDKDYSLVALYITAGVDPNLQINGNSWLHYLIREPCHHNPRRFFDFIDDLQAKGLDLSLKQHANLLIEALEYGGHEVVEFLLERKIGIPESKEDLLYSIQENCGLKYADRLLTYIDAENIDVRILSDGIDRTVTAMNRFIATKHLAQDLGRMHSEEFAYHFAMFEILTKYGAEPTVVLDEKVISLVSHSDNAVEELLRIWKHFRDTPLRKKMEMCILRIALMRFSSPREVSLLLDAGIPIVSIADDNTPVLFYLIPYFRESAWGLVTAALKILALLTSKGIDLSVTDPKGRNLLMYAILCGIPELTEQLCKLRGHFNADAQDNDGNTALMHAVKIAGSPQPEIGSIIISHVLTLDPNIHMRNQQGNTAIDLANNNSDVLGMLSS